MPGVRELEFVRRRDCREGEKTAKRARTGGPQPIAVISSDREERILTGNEELDRVLGGGFVPGSVILVGGDPGIGKSTLALQMLNYVSERAGRGESGDRRFLYVTGEESPVQVKMRAERTGVSSGNVYVLTETSVEAILEQMDKARAGDSRNRFHTDYVHGDVPIGAGQRRADKGIDGAAHALC